MNLARYRSALAMRTHAVSTATTIAVAGVTCAVAPSASAQYSRDNVTLYAQLDLGDLGGNPDNGNDIWGYVSPSGREYALMGVSNALKVVEITDPQNPTVIGTVGHTNSLWGDMKTYLEYAYVSNEDGGGIDVIDLSDVDNGNVTYVRSIVTNGIRTAHNVAINEESGYLYALGSNLNGGTLVAFDLSTPDDPTFAGLWSNGSYIHDAQIITYTDGTYAGREIAFCFNGEVGIEIVDVTDKSNIFKLSTTTYSRLAYAHQGWVSDDRQYLYSNDELDELFFFQTTRTRVFDITDLSNPVYRGFFTTGSRATDHNMYVHNGYLFQANYRSGLWVLDLDDPERGVVTGSFDTYPANDLSLLDGAWGVYPFFPSGTVVVSDMQRGLFVCNVNDAIGNRLALDVPTLTGGQAATLTATDATPGETVYFVYGFGTGSTPVPPLAVTLGISGPALAGSDVADGSGAASFSGNIPAAGSGFTVHLQAIEFARTSEVISALIN